MKKAVVVVLLMVVCLGGRILLSHLFVLENETPLEAGLHWQECLVSAEPDFQHVQDCFGDAPHFLSPSEMEKTRFGQQNKDCFSMRFRKVLHGLSGAHVPYYINHKLLFIGEDEGKQFIVYDSAKIVPEFDRINLACCCEAQLWSAQYGDGKYRFWGKRDGQMYVVQLTASESVNDY